MSILYLLKKVAATLLTAIMLLFSITHLSAEPYETKKPDEVKLNFTVISDCHIEGPDVEFTFLDTYRVFAKILCGAKKANNGNDAIVFLGDNTMNGQNIENMLFFGGVRMLRPAEEIIVAAGNHDLSNDQGEYSKFVDRFIGYSNSFLSAELTTPYFFRIINGCYFIMLSSEETTVDTMYLSDEQLLWLEDILKQADEADAPIFVISHHPADYLEDREPDELTDILKDYDNLLYFCGHTHHEISSDSIYNLNGVNCINLPRCTEWKAEGYDTGIGAQVEVYEKEILVRIRDYYDGLWLEGHEYSYPVEK